MDLHHISSVGDERTGFPGTLLYWQDLQIWCAHPAHDSLAKCLMLLVSTLSVNDYITCSGCVLIDR